MDADDGRRWRGRRLALALLAGALWVVPTVAAHGGALSSARQDPIEIPFWLYLVTGGGVVGASFLLASFLTDRSLLEAIHGWRASIPVPDAVLTWAARLGGLAGVVVLSLVVLASVFGPRRPTANFAILVVWVGWWAGLVMFVYLVGDVWRVVDPWRTLGRALGPRPRVPYPEQLGSWPAVVGVLALVWIEVVSPVSDRPLLLGVAAVGYTVLTAAGAVAFGAGVWFREADPIAHVFRFYGRVAPVRRGANGFEIALPAARLTDLDGATGFDDVAFVVAVLWATTYDGLLSTPTWAGLTRWLVGLGLPPLSVYFATLAVGFALFLGAYRVAADASREYATSFLPPARVRAAFALSLLPIAAGYHLAHFLGYFLTLFPVLLSLLGPISLSPLVLPAWFGALPIAFVLIGHLLAVGVAHTTAFELFPHRVQAIRSQYPLVAVMVVYTMVSLWIVSRPSVPHPFL
ncbi:MAG: hypothetical protein ABEI96_05575 [Haloarculaceae archaeon]